MKNKKLEEYNVKDSLLVISSYPRKKEKYSKGVCAVASFAKNTLSQIQKQNPDKKIVVLTMKLGSKEEVYQEDNMLIVRCFKRNSPFSYLNIARYLRFFNNIKTVLLEFEFSSFGDLLATGSLSILVWAMFFLKKDIHLVVHQVVLDLGEISGHIGIKQNSLKIRFFNFALCYFYKFLTFPAKTVIVLEDELKKRLGKVINENKITVIPHGVDLSIASKLTVQNAKKKLGFSKNDFVILYFGYLTWYKGVDFLIKSLQKHTEINGKKIKLVIAGGPSFTQGKKKHYQKFLEKTEKLARNYQHIQITGFIPEDKISLYFKSADLAVFPYRQFMSSSGPFSLALSFGKPIILSKNLSGLLKSKDVKEALEKAGLNENVILFNLNENNLVTKIRQVVDSANHKKLLSFSKALAEKRAFASIASSYIRTISLFPQKNYSKKILVSPHIAG